MTGNREPEAARRRRPAPSGHRAAIAVILVAVGVGTAIALWPRANVVVDVVVPPFSSTAQRGAQVFAQNCSTCHGANAGGGPGGPPLVHRIYEPGHHADGAFFRAVTRGVPQHHWQFGDMPPIPGLDEQQIFATIRYVRELQQANGIR